MNLEIPEHGLQFLKDSAADAVAISVIDFRAKAFEFWEISDGEVRKANSKIFFDLASLTKPLTNSIVALSLGVNEKERLLLNHRGGLPAWGILDRYSWRQQMESYAIKASATEYSDFSALRLMIELENRHGIYYPDYLQSLWAPGILFWKQLSAEHRVLQNGYEKGKPVAGRVHDPNARNINEFCAHAGLFGTIEGLSQTLLAMDEKLGMLDTVAGDISDQRFCWGFDTAQGEETLAGGGCSVYTFGHLGFTGTSFWIDAQKKRACAILSNATKYHWFDKTRLNQLRRKLGAMTWQKK